MDVLHGHAAGPALGNEGGAQGEDVVFRLRNGGEQRFFRLKGLVHGIGMGDVDLPVFSQTGLVQLFGEKLQGVAEAPAAARATAFSVR